MAFGKATIQSMERAGWEFSDSESSCNKCGQAIRWGRSPEGKNMSFDPHPSTNYHIKACPGVPTRPASTVPPPAARPTQRLDRAAAPAQAGNLQSSIDDLTTAVRALLAELIARRTATPPAGRIERRVGVSGEPYDVHHDR